MAELYRLPDDLETEEEQLPPRTMTVELDPPIQFQKKEFRELQLVEPNGKQVYTAELELGKDPTPGTLRRYQITLIAQSARVPREVVELMPVSQIGVCFRFLSSLLDVGPETGGTS